MTARRTPVSSSGPDRPDRLGWAPEIPVRYADLDGMRLRYIATGSGAPLVLLHTLRTQLDIFARMTQALAARFEVYALDYPGHGHSEAPDGRYDAGFFTAAVEAFLERLDLRQACLAGVSIGGVIPLLMAARRNPRVARVISINPYDYAAGLGLARSSLAGWIVAHAARVPVMGEIAIPPTPRWLVRRVLEGGVADARRLPPQFVLDVWRAGRRPGSARAFLRLLRNARSWQDARREYRHIDTPVLLIWSDGDWSRPRERARTAALVPGAVVKTVPDGGHFLPLDQPDALAGLIIEFAGS